MNILMTIAQTIDAKDVGVPTASANDILKNGLYVTYFVAGIVAVIMIIIAGLRMVAAVGNPETVKQARNTILYSVIGLVVILTAFTVTWFVVGRFG